MLAGIATINTMITIGVNLHVELFIQLYQMLGIFGTILEMNIIICHTVYQQEVTVSLIRPCESQDRLLHSSFCHISAVAPSPDANTIFIHIR